MEDWLHKDQTEDWTDADQRPDVESVDGPTSELHVDLWIRDQDVVVRCERIPKDGRETSLYGRRCGSAFWP